MVSLHLVLGPMASGKTTELLRRASTAVAMGLKVGYFNSHLDTRSLEEISSHRPTMKEEGITYLKVASLPVSVSEFDLILLDEAQFFDSLYSTVEHWLTQGKEIVIAGLNGDYQRKAFGQILSLIPLCSSLQLLTAYCRSCAELDHCLVPAPFTKRVVPGNSQILIGGTESYQPVCFRHFQ